MFRWAYNFIVMKLEIMTHTTHLFRYHIFHAYYPKCDEELNAVFNFVGLLSSNLLPHHLHRFQIQPNPQTVILEQILSIGVFSLVLFYIHRSYMILFSIYSQNLQSITSLKLYDNYYQ